MEIAPPGDVDVENKDKNVFKSLKANNDIIKRMNQFDPIWMNLCTEKKLSNNNNRLQGRMQAWKYMGHSNVQIAKKKVRKMANDMMNYK